jgi:eukaryotic-like serine/threonine-protein kinase
VEQGAASVDTLGYAPPRVGLEQYGRYEALHRLASGGMASVYLGRTRGPGGFERLVAIKVMHEHIAHDPEFSGMFLDEARLAARIRHPNVVPTLDVAEGGHYIVMEYVEGASLHAILRRFAQAGQRLPLPAALRIFVDTLSGLHAAHELTDHGGKALNIVHRDVSPHNILVGVDGQSRITDFGIAYAESRITSTRGGELKGKLPYMAPEQLEDRGVDRRTDVYAAGCVLWEMLVGRRLFTGSSEAAIACAILAGPQHSPRQEGADVPEALDAACMQSLSGLDGRFLTALAFSEAVERAADVADVRLARNRDVGPIAQQTALTFPAPASIISGAVDSATDPIPATVVEGAPATAEPDSPMPATVPVRRSGTEEMEPLTEPGGNEAMPATQRASGSAPPSTEIDDPVPAATPAGKTLESEPYRQAHGQSAPPSGAATTTDDRPPPEVAAVIQAEIDRRREEDLQRSPPMMALDTTATSVGKPPLNKSSRWVTVAAAVVVALVLAAWVALSGDSERSTAGDASSADAPSSTLAQPRVDATAVEPGTPPRPDLSATTSAGLAAPPPSPAPTARSTPPGPMPAPPSPVPATPPPSPASTGYHPSTP